MSASTETQSPNPLTATTAVVIDDDESMTALLEDYLTGLGVKEIAVALTGDAAWDLVKAKTFDLVILDWRLPGVSGLALFNRIRQLARFDLTPICISSGLLTREDCFLLEEYPATRLLAKPYTEELFTECIAKLLQDTAWRRANIKDLTDIVTEFRANPGVGMQRLQQALASAPDLVPVVINTAKVMRQAGHYAEAAALLHKALQRAPDSILALSELGKTLHCQGKSDDAYKVLKKAGDMSPKNLARLSLLGEIDLTRGDPATAAANFRKALQIDVADEKAKAGLVTAENLAALAPADGDPRAPGLMGSMAGLLNVTAVTLVRKGEFAKAIEQYQAAFHFLNDGVDKARVAFNMGLCFLKWARPGDAATSFQQAVDFSGGSLTKAADYLTRLREGKQFAGGAAVDANAPLEDVSIK